MKDVRTIHTFKELIEIAGDWVTREIRNNYTRGSNSFTMIYKGQVIRFQNDNVLEVASAATQFNGLSWVGFLEFEPKYYNK